MHRRDVLITAENLTCGERNNDYGSVKENMANIAAGWSLIVGAPISGEQAAMMMTWLKICRAKASPGKADHYIDGAAYMAMAGECADAKL